MVTGDTLSRRRLVAAHHDPPVYSHPGISRTTDIIANKYWWPGMQEEIQEYVRGCVECQRNKVNTHQTHAALRPISPTPQALPFETIAMDFIVKLPPSKGYDTILTVTNHDCSKLPTMTVQKW